MHTAPRSTALASALVCVVSAWAPMSARASDRPYLVISSAAAAEQEGSAWAVESWATQLAELRAFNVAPSYAFSATTFLQLQLGKARQRESDEKASFAELEFKHLFNRITSDGYGWGFTASLGAVKPDHEAARREAWSVKVPFTLSLGEGAGLLHLNAGYVRPSDEGHQWLTAAALERQLWQRTVLFAEVARIGELRSLHAGVRQWIKPDKWAIDFSFNRTRSDNTWRNGGTIGFGWYDL